MNGYTVSIYLQNIVKLCSVGRNVFVENLFETYFLKEVDVKNRRRIFQVKGY